MSPLFVTVVVAFALMAGAIAGWAACLVMLRRELLAHGPQRLYDLIEGKS